MRTIYNIVTGEITVDPDFVPEPVAPSPSRVPTEVSRGQALIALFQAASITDAMIESKIAAIPDDAERYITRVRFQEPRWRRDSPFIAWGAEQFGLTEAETDALFLAASNIP
jgi:hypothetical protein